MPLAIVPCIKSDHRGSRTSQCPCSSDLIYSTLRSLFKESNFSIVRRNAGIKGIIKGSRDHLYDFSAVIISKSFK
jgi:hypothetical protein